MAEIKLFSESQYFCAILNSFQPNKEISTNEVPLQTLRQSSKLR